MNKTAILRCWLLVTGSLALLAAAGCVPVPVVLLPGGAGIGGGEQGEDVALADQTIEHVNAERVAHGLPALVKSDKLTAAALAHATRMAEGGFFAHQDPETGSMPWDRAEAAGYSYAIIAENIAAGYPTVAMVVDGWMHSPEHRENILLPDVSETGVAVFRGGPVGIYWVQVFGLPQ